ncbi:DUF397 domain-containing protein [Streptomyces sp. NPDC002851]
MISRSLLRRSFAWCGVQARGPRRGASGGRARDSKQQAGPVLTSTVERWQAFIASVVDGAFGEL